MDEVSPKKPKKNYGEHREGGPHNYVAEILDNPDNVASANECTGLIPVPPQNMGETEAYSGLYVVPEQPQDLGANGCPIPDELSGH